MHMYAKLSVFLLALSGLAQLDLMAAATTRPNVVMIISDDQTWTDFGFMGHNLIRTPNLDRLASQGLLFPNGYVTMSLCRPSLVSIVTGLYPHQSGIANNYPVGTPMLDHPPYVNSRTGEYWQLHQKMIQNLDFVPTLPGLLGEWGYKSFQSGKWWEGHFGRGGFTHGMTLGTPSHVAKTTGYTWRGGPCPVFGCRGIAIGRDVGLKAQTVLESQCAQSIRRGGHLVAVLPEYLLEQRLLVELDGEITNVSLEDSRYGSLQLLELHGTGLQQVAQGMVAIRTMRCVTV